MWNDLSRQWQTAFREAWEAFRTGGVPIGAAIFSQDGTLVISDHNRSGEQGVVNGLISHAEANCLRRLDLPDAEKRAATLYTTMEPCPMCMGTCVMGHIRHLRYAARDPFCGFVYVKDTDPYMMSKGLDYTFEDAETEFVQIAVQCCYELDRIERGVYGDKVYRSFADMRPDAARAAGELYSGGAIAGFARENRDFGEVYDHILSLAER